MIGFWVFCLCLYRFAARRTGPLFAAPALLLPFASDSYGYSFEARCYGMLAGFAGVALLSWQAAAAEEKRRIALCGLALGLAGAVLCHYYAVLLYVPLAGGEAMRTWLRRRIDWPVWTAFAAGAMPFAASWLALRGTLAANRHPWAVARVRDYLDYYESEFQHAIPFALAALVLVAIYAMWNGRIVQPQAGSPRGAIPRHELLAAALFLAVPAAAITIALAVSPHMFVPRYAIIAIAGPALLVPLLAARFAGARPAVGAALAAAALVPFVGELVQARRPANPLDSEPILAAALRQGPVVVADGVAFLQLWHYAPAELQPRLMFVADMPSAVRYTGVDTIDLNLISTARVIPIPVVSYQEFYRSGREFTLYMQAGSGWLPRRVLAEGGTLEPLRRGADRTLAVARFK
jgi:hypothetical protein